MAAEHINLYSDENEYSIPNSTPDHDPPNSYPDFYNAINQLIASQLEQRLIIGTATVPCPPTPSASITSDDDEQHNNTPVVGEPAQYTSHIPQRRHNPIQLCEQLQPISDTPESLAEDQGQKDIFRHYDLCNSSTKFFSNGLPKTSAKVDSLKTC